VKIYLDDERPTPAGWVRASWPDEVIKLLSAGGVTALSSDHDLGDDERGTGYDVVLWLEEAVERERLLVDHQRLPLGQRPVPLLPRAVASAADHREPKQQRQDQHRPPPAVTTPAAL
jgi:hypothetical protein